MTAQDNIKSNTKSNNHPSSESYKYQRNYNIKESKAELLLSTLLDMDDDYEEELSTTDSLRFPATSVRGSYTLKDIEQAYDTGMSGSYVSGDSSFVDFVVAGCIEDELELYRAKKDRAARKDKTYVKKQ